MSARFRYRAATAGGELLEGVLQAASERAALEELRRQALHPVTVEPLDAGARRAARRTGKRPAVAVWTRTLATLVSSGMPLDRALGFAAEHGTNEAVRDAARAVRDDVRSGATLAAAMRRRSDVFAPLDVAMIAAAEEGGALDAALARLATHLEEALELRAQVLSALLYPAVMAAVAAVGIAVLLLVVVPRFTAMLSELGGTLPLSTRILVGASGVTTRYWGLLLVLAAGAALAARRWLAEPANRRRWDDWRRGLPVVGALELALATARFTRTLGMLLRSGVAILPALRVAVTVVGNRALADEVERATLAVAQGRRVSAALDGVLPPLAVQLLAAGEEAGRLDELSLRAADAYDAEARRTLRTLTGIVEPAFILAFGVMVGFVALAMLQAIYSVNARIV